MILLIHNNKAVISIKDLDTNKSIDLFNLNCIKSLFALAKKYPENILVWCHEKHKNNIDFEEINTIFYLKNMMFSYSDSDFLPKQIGYVDINPLLKVNKEVKYPTWFMSSQIGAIYGSQLDKFKNIISTNSNFDYALNSIAKIGMPRGLFCYSEPRLIKKSTQKVKTPSASLSMLFKFVKQHYKWKWLFFLSLCFLLYDKKPSFFNLIRSIFYKNLNKNIEFDIVRTHPREKLGRNNTMDVIIPTIGRKKYVYDVLKDLSKQTVLPKNVIIVEQNPLIESVSELDYLVTESWPFRIKHIFTHQSGVCNARNRALEQVESEWVFLNDDDNRFQKDLIEIVFNKAEQLGIKVITTAYLQKGETQRFNLTHQTGIFGSGNSFVKTECLNGVNFNMSLEFGYGEDFDFGMQLRNKGIDVIYLPDLFILHLKAPIGGFRVKIKQLWENDPIQPTPSPTIMYNNLKYQTKEQISNYKLLLFLKLLKKESVINYMSFYKTFQKKFDASIKWANKLVEFQETKND